MHFSLWLRIILMSDQTDIIIPVRSCYVASILPDESRQYGINAASYFLTSASILSNLAWHLSVGDLRQIGIKARNLKSCQ